MTSTYLSYQLYANNMSRSLQQVAAEPNVANDQKYYAANIGKVKSVDDFLGNYRLFSYAMKASGLADMTYAKAFMKKVLTSDLSNSKSFVNQLTDTRFKAFAQNFSFTTKGAVGTTTAAQTSTQESKTVSLYTAKTGTSSIDGVLATSYYESHIGNVKSVKDLMGDSQLLNYVMTAYGLDATTLTKGTYAQSTSAENDLTSVFESDASDAGSTANQLATGKATASGIPLSVQSAANQDSLEGIYTNANGRTTDLIYYENTIQSVHSIDAFLADPKLVSVAEKAYGLDGKGYSSTDLKRIMTSDLDDPMSVANQLGPGAIGFAKSFNFATSSTTINPYLAIAQDFNFDANGAAASARSAQSTSGATGTETLYQGRAKSDKASQVAATTESNYYSSAIGSVTTLDGLLGNARLVSYVKTAYGLDPKTSTDTLRQILTSDLSNSKSVANKMGSAARQLSAAFNFSTTGTISRPTAAAESAKNVQMLGDSYLQQTLEDEAGTDNQGVKLALYFQRKASSGAITSAYSILADAALTKVVQTALNIPASASSLNIDAQAKQITNRLKIDDLKDPVKLKKFVTQFATLYDVANASSSSDTISALFG